MAERHGGPAGTSRTANTNAPAVYSLEQFGHLSFREQLIVKSARAAERERIGQRITRDKIDWFIHLLDLVDKLAESNGMDTGPEMQDDLRWLADMLGGDGDE